MNMFLISIKGKFNSLVKIFNLQNFISYQKPDFIKFHSRYSKSFFVYKILPFLPFYKVIVVDNFECCTEGFFQKAVNIYLRSYQNIYCKSSYAVLISILWAYLLSLIYQGTFLKESFLNSAESLHQTLKAHSLTWSLRDNVTLKL